MKKIPTLFVRDPINPRNITREVHPACQWVMDGVGRATRKYDGTCVMMDDWGFWWTRRTVKPGRMAPKGFRPVETDEVTGITVGWEKPSTSPFQKHLNVAIERLSPADMQPGTYELCGPFINGNPEGYTLNTLIRHSCAELILGAPREYDPLEEFMSDFPYEGIVWHHPDGVRMAKIKRRDFSL